MELSYFLVVAICIILFGIFHLDSCIYSCNGDWWDLDAIFGRFMVDRCYNDILCAVEVPHGISWDHHPVENDKQHLIRHSQQYSMAWYRITVTHHFLSKRCIINFLRRSSLIFVHVCWPIHQTWSQPPGPTRATCEVFQKTMGQEWPTAWRRLLKNALVVLQNNGDI